MLGIVTGLLGGFIAPLVEQLSETAARLARKIALLLFAVLCLVIVVIALTVAFFLWLATVATPVVAALSVAGFYATAAVIAVVLAVREPKTKQPALEVPTPEDAARDAARADRASQIDDVTAPLMAFLSKFGLRREQLAVMAGASVAKQIGPLPLVGLAIVGGFLIGRMWKGWRAIPEIVAGLASSGLFGFGADEEPSEPETRDEAA